MKMLAEQCNWLSIWIIAFHLDKNENTPPSAGRQTSYSCLQLVMLLNVTACENFVLEGFFCQKEDYFHLNGSIIALMIRLLSGIMEIFCKKRSKTHNNCPASKNGDS